MMLESQNSRDFHQVDLEKKNMTFGLHFPGKIRNINLPSTQGLLPIFEAIANSIDAIEEAGFGIDRGEIQIIVHRINDSLLKDEEQSKINPIQDFEIIDNGKGFTEENFSSFSVSHSPKKWSIGGKGEGRFTWLKVFEHVHIDSVYWEAEEYHQRQFDFVLAEDPLPEIRHKITTGGNGPLATSIRLIGLRQEYSANIPKRLRSIADRIIEHFFAYFVLNRMPKIFISDEDEHISLNNIYAEEIANQAKTEFGIDSVPFTIYHFLRKSTSGSTHRIHFCAIRRVVDSMPVDNKTVPNLPSRIPSGDGEGNLIYVSYLLSPLMDDKVNTLRTGFTLPRRSSIEMKYGGEVYWDDIHEMAVKSAIDYLEPITEPIKVEKEKKVQEYVFNGNGFPYRGMIKHHPEILDQIPPNLEGSKLDLELFKAKRQIEENLKEKSDEILNSSDDILSNPEDVEKKYDNFLEQLNDFSKDALAEYVVHRRRTLDHLQRFMDMGEDGKHAKEVAIHKLIFPIRSTSDEIDYDQQNLWIIDEKLSFHRYLSSDLPLNKVEVIDSTDKDRPDLLFFFDRPIAVVEGEPKNSVTIFEFKRPMRDDSDPVEQMVKYVRKIRENKETTNKNRPFTVNESTPFYCYAICDIKEKLHNDFFYTHQMTKTPDGEGYFTFHCLTSEDVGPNRG